MTLLVEHACISSNNDPNPNLNLNHGKIIPKTFALTLNLQKDSMAQKEHRA